MNVLVVEPGKAPYESDISPGLESLQKVVGGYIEITYPFDDPVAVVCNEEGKLLGLLLNRALRDESGNVYDILSGNFLIVGLGEEDLSGLSNDLLEKYKDRFQKPEQFVKIGGRILVVEMPAPREKPQQRSASGADPLPATASQRL